MNRMAANYQYLAALSKCGGYYACPKDTAGRRLGPLVGYAAKYPVPDGTQKQWVGDVYANFAKVDEKPKVLYDFALAMRRVLVERVVDVDVFCGAPIGGYSFAEMLGLVCGQRVIKAEKKITALATATMREQSDLVFARHGIEEGMRYVIVEDVCNNFSTTETLIALITGLGGKVIGIACELNRSLDVVDSYPSKVAGREIPVVALLQMPIPEYKQEDPAVAEDIKNGNVVWKPKDEWPRLMSAMSAAR